MRTSLARLGVFFIGFPLCIGIVVFLPAKNHLAANLLVSAVSTFGALEFAEIIGKKGLGIKKAEALLFGLLPPLSFTLSVSFNFPMLIPVIVIFLLSSWILSSNIFCKEQALEKVIGRISGGLAVLFYPSIFLCWMILINQLHHSPYLLGFFITIVIITDSLGWAFGVLFGTGNRGIIPVSPNKSAAGYAGSILGTAAVCAVAGRFMPEIFAQSRLSPLVSAFIVGFVTALTSQVGDLVESAVKRSAGVKDSGRIMPGRGGILDSVDSLAFAGPFFYFCFRALLLP
ncbi:MAG: phosphatidate cytidylyltransferase [Spirochaetaceae bacterium]|nr:phosphatidate cytidylyltransferase [Spirochaetaceae bacterium]